MNIFQTCKDLQAGHKELDPIIESILADVLEAAIFGEDSRTVALSWKQRALVSDYFQRAGFKVTMTDFFGTETLVTISWE